MPSSMFPNPILIHHDYRFISAKNFKLYLEQSRQTILGLGLTPFSVVFRLPQSAFYGLHANRLHT